MPGLRGTPEVITTTSELALSAKSFGANADHARRRAFDRARLVDVERDAGGLRVGNVDDHDVGELLLRDRTRHRCADVARTTDDRHFSIHHLTPIRSASLCLARPAFHSFCGKPCGKAPREHRVTLVFRNKSANCTIRGASDVVGDQANRIIFDSIFRPGMPSMLIVVADDLPKTAARPPSAPKAGRSMRDPVVPPNN